MSERADPRIRLSIVGVVVVSLFVSLFARLWYLQVVERPQLAEPLRHARQHVEHRALARVEDALRLGGRVAEALGVPEHRALALQRFDLPGARGEACQLLALEREELPARLGAGRPRHARRQALLDLDERPEAARHRGDQALEPDGGVEVEPRRLGAQ